MIRRLSTKWVLAVLVAVTVPFVGLAVFVSTELSDRLAGEVVRYHLLSLSADLTDWIDDEIAERQLDLEHLVSNPVIAWHLEAQGERSGQDEAAGVEGPWEESAQVIFDAFFLPRSDSRPEANPYDLLVAIDGSGDVVAHNRLGRGGMPLPEAVTTALAEHDFSRDPWFQEALESGSALIDHGHFELLPVLHAGEVHPEDYHVAFARSVDVEGERRGVVLLVMNWSIFQNKIDTFGIRRLTAGSSQPEQGVGTDIYASSYGWIWKSDADTIIAHKDRALYGKRVTEPPISLPKLSAIAKARDWGMYPPYQFREVMKKAAFKKCMGPDEGGFGWVIGIGVDDKDIFGPVHEVQSLLLKVSSSVLAITLLWALFVARRALRPIRELQRHTRRIASGDLDARIQVTRTDELGELADSFNRMTAELKENREQLVRAEKDAAWREMARQVAHEIKNPLTPISLSVGLLSRARDDGREDFDVVLDRTLEMIQRQVDGLRQIATDFYAFAERKREAVDVDAGAVLDEVLDLHRAWAADQGIEVTRSGGTETVLGDAHELQRALVNLISNAIEAMEAGGTLAARISSDGDEVVIELEDSGPGISKELESRLFEPYFTTRNSGTGLGLAIVRRVIEDMGGRTTLENNADGPGAVARIHLPRKH